MADGIRIGNYSISSFKVGVDDCSIYLGDVKLYPQGGYDLCYDVVDDISDYQGSFADVFEKSTETWYKLNNLGEYEQYGIYGSGRNITTYKGKLTIDGDHEYEWNGSSWVDLGEVTGSTATLPDVPFTVNINAKNYDASTKTFAKTDGQLANTDITITAGTPTLHGDYVTVARNTRGVISGYGVYFVRTASAPTLTIISKQRTDGSDCHLFANRDSNYNWMYRPTSTKLNFHGNSQIAGTDTTTQPVIESVRVDSNRLLTFNNYTDNTTASSSNFSYGSSNGTVALFAGYASTTGEWFSGDFYWLYMSQTTLTDAQVQQVIAYNEGGSQSEYPKYYSDKADPLNNLTFNTLAEAETYAMSNCVYDGMRATIGGSRYVFDSVNGWTLIPEYYKVEDVTPSSQGGSGWTINGSATYNPDLTYYDDFNVETNTTAYQWKVAKVTIYGYENFTYYLRGYGYAHYGYAYATNVDELSSDPTTNFGYNSNNAVTNTYDFNKAAGSAVNLSNYRRVTYNNLDKTVEHTFYVIFYGRSYGSIVSNATILIPKEQTNENFEQVTFSASTNVAPTKKNLYIDGSNSSNGGTINFYYRWMIGLPAGSHTSYTNYSNVYYCPTISSATFTSVAGNSRQVDYIYQTNPTTGIIVRLVDGDGNVLTPPVNSVSYNVYRFNPCGNSVSSGKYLPGTVTNLYVGGRFRFEYYNNQQYIYGYQPPSVGTTYNVDDYDTFDLVYTELDKEAVTITYTTYDPNDAETPTFNTDVTWPYGGGTTSSSTLASFDVPYTYEYTVGQTSNLFSANTQTQTYTAGQASRTITFLLYPNNREFQTVADMEAYQYAWEGMKAKVGSTNYKYENGQWVEIQLIEYLECSGSQYINTNAYVNKTNFEIGYTVNNNNFIWGWVHQGTGANAWVGVERSKAFFGSYDYKTVNIGASTSSTENVIEYKSNSGITVNNTFYAKTLEFRNNNDDITTIPIYLFARYDFKIRGLEINESTKLKRFYAKVDGEFVLDMIPVRVGQVGYMYDKVSEQLFGNDGSGSFILGADK